MKIKFILVLMLLTPSLLMAQGKVVSNKANFNLSVEIKGLKTKNLYLTFQKSKDEISRDSSEIRKGKYIFKGTVTSPVICTLSDDNENVISEFWLENSTITISGKFGSDYLINGSETENEANNFKKVLSVYDISFKALNDEFKAAKKIADKDKITEVTNAWHKLTAEWTSTIFQFIKEHPASYVAIKQLHLLSQKKDVDFKMIKDYYNSFNNDLQNSEEGIQLINQIKEQENKALNLAEDIVQPDVEGKLIHLSDYKGKFVLLDFWASWCGPCRAENSNVLAAYNKFHRKGLEILAVSLDSKKEAWLKAVETDKLPWKQVSDLKGWSNEAAAKYHVSGIPANFLISPDGKIIAERLRGNDLDKKLAEIFK